MREFQAKKRIRRVVYSKATLVVFVLLLALIGKATWSMYTRERESAERRLRMARELERVESRHALLTSEIARLSTDEGIEEEIRNTYSVSKPGERLLVIVDPDVSSSQATSTAPESWWGKLKEILK